MDPKQTLKDLLTALHSGRREDAIECCENLSIWLRNGGLLPEVRAGSRVNSYLLSRLDHLKSDWAKREILERSKELACYQWVTEILFPTHS